MMKMKVVVKKDVKSFAGTLVRAGSVLDAIIQSDGCAEVLRVGWLPLAPHEWELAPRELLETGIQGA